MAQYNSLNVTLPNSQLNINLLSYKLILSYQKLKYLS